MSSLRNRPRTLALAAFAAVTSVMVLAGCSAGGNESPKESDPDAPIVVWTDGTREPMFEAYQKEHPDVELDINVFDEGQFLTKVQLFNRAGKGWPDVVFLADPNKIAALASPLYDDFPAPLTDAVPQDVQEGFGASNDGCMIDGELVCLKNDLSQTVLFVNEPLMAEFGYDVPTTWDEYQALGADVAQNHPGYVVGAAGGVSTYYEYFWSSGCPTQKVVDSREVEINLADDTCTRVADTLDPMLADGSVSRYAPFDAEMMELGKQNKILLLPGPTWYQDLFKGESAYAAAPGTISVAPYPTWEGEETNWSGNMGGGIYVVSRHATNLDGAIDVATWVSTNTELQAETVTYPAYGPAAEAWGEKISTDSFFASDPFPALQEAAANINPAVSPTRYDAPSAYANTVVSAVRSGKTIADALPGLQSQLTQLAQQAGYAVTGQEE